MLLLWTLACTAPDVGPADATDETSLDDDASAAVFSRDRVLEVAVEMDAADFAELRGQTRDIVSLLSGDCLAEPLEDPYTWFHADATLDGEPIADVGIRKRGLLGSASTTKPGLKLKFDKYTDDDRTWSGLERLTFTNAQQDPTLLRTCLTYDTFRAAGLPAPRCGYAHVTVNGEDLGAYVNVEHVDDAFLARWFGDDTGNLYEGTLSDFRDGWTGSFEAKNDDADYRDLQAVADALKVGDDALLAEVDAVVDLDRYLAFWAHEVLVGHWDGYAGNTNNFFVYADPADGRLRFVPWGADATFDGDAPFGAGASVAVVANAALPVRLSQTEEGRARYEAALRDAAEGWDDAATLAEIDRLATLLDPWLDRGTNAALDDLRGIVGARKDAVLSELDAGLDWAPYLRGDPCLVSHGSVVADFTATWGSYGVEDPLTAGTASVTMTWDGASYTSVTGGVVAGDADGQALIVAVGGLGYGAYVAPYVVFDPSRVAPGVLPLDADMQGYLLYMDETTGNQFTTAAYLGDGSLTLTAGGTGDGDVVTGRIEAELYAGG